MKKALSLLLTLAVFVNCLTLFVYADNSALTVGLEAMQEQSSEQTDETEGELPIDNENRGEITTCLYNTAQKTITISGVINHDVMVTHKGYSIALYAIPTEARIEDIINDPDIKPLATTSISLKFNFLVNIETNIERFYQYAVVIYDDSGDKKLIDKPIYASVSSDYSYKADDKSGYKGIRSELVSSAADIGVGNAIIPVYLERLLSDSSSGYLYSLQGSYIYFDKNYINELDAKIKALYVTGSQVYLQFLITPNTDSGISVLGISEEIDYDIPDMDVPQTINLISAFTSFLCERYDTTGSGKITGIVLGDMTDQSYTDVYTVEEYALNYAMYMLVVGNSARGYISDIDIVIPFSDNNSYSVQPSPAWKCAPSDIIESVCEQLEKMTAHKFDFSLLVKSESVPYGISDEAIKKGKFSVGSYDGINADNADIYSDYLEILGIRYDNAPSSFIFVWCVPDGISGNVLTTAYSYSYYKLLSNKRLKSFVISFENSEETGDFSRLSEISRIMNYIDTVESFNITAPQLDLLGKKSWFSVIGNMYGGTLDTRRVVSAFELNQIPSSIIGSYAYFDFSYHTDLSSWFCGASSDSLKIDYSDISGRSLNAHFLRNGEYITEYSELYCAYDYAENLKFTPYIGTKFSIVNDTPDSSELYEVKLTYASDNTVAESRRVCRANEEVEILIDISAFNDVAMADYLKISVRRLSDKAEDEGGYTLSLLSITGYSTKYLSEELSSLIAEERLRIRNEHSRTERNENEEINSVFIVAGVIVMASVIGIGVFMCFRREEE